MRKLCFVCIMSLLLPCLAWCQRDTARLSGTVTDSSGAVVAGANLTATDVTTGATYKATADAGGFYVLNNLAPNEYRLEIRKSGFKTEVQSGIILSVGQ